MLIPPQYLKMLWFIKPAVHSNMNLQRQSGLTDKKNVLDVLMAEGYIEAGRVDPILLTTLVEDLMLIPGSINERRILLPGPKFGLKQVPAYVFNNGNKKSFCLKFTDVVDKSSASAALNLILFDTFSEIEKVEQLIYDEKCDEAYNLIKVIESSIHLTQIYYSNEFHDIQNKITTLKRKIEIENNIFLIN
jgi:hypothetical protein